MSEVTANETTTNDAPAGDTPPAAPPAEPGQTNTDITADPPSGDAPPAAAEGDAPADPPNTDITADGDGSEPPADDDAEPEAHPYHGEPEEGTSYEAFELPAHFQHVMDEANASAFGELARELGLNQAGAQKAVDFLANMQTDALRAVEDTVNAAREEWRTELMKDPVLGGANLPEALGQAKAAYAAIPNGLGQALMEDMKHAGLGSLPSFVRLGHYMHSIMAEAGVMQRGNADDPGVERSIAQRMFPNMPSATE